MSKNMSPKTRNVNFLYLDINVKFCLSTEVTSGFLYLSNHDSNVNLLLSAQQLKTGSTSSCREVKEG